MKKSTSIIIILVIIAILIAFVCFIYFYQTPTSNHEMNKIENQVTNSEGQKESKNEVINEIEENNGIANTINTSKEDLKSNANQINNNVQENEEKASSEENKGVNEEEKAIQMAKEAWGLDINSYTFTIDSKEGDIYHIQVNANAQAIAYYDVNVKTGEVTEK